MAISEFLRKTVSPLHKKYRTQKLNCFFKELPRGWTKPCSTWVAASE